MFAAHLPRRPPLGHAVLQAVLQRVDPGGGHVRVVGQAAGRVERRAGVAALAQAMLLELQQRVGARLANGRNIGA